jgi:hypothetical protein
MSIVNFQDLILILNELRKLGLEVFKLWLLAVEVLESFIDLLGPQPAVVLKTLQELVDIVLGSLNGTGQEKNNLDDFLVLSDPIIEWLTLILRNVLLVPVLHMLG